MNFDDEKILNNEEYEKIAKAYSLFLQENGFKIIKSDDKYLEELISDTFNLLRDIKNCLFRLGGFLNTGKLYNLTDKQMKKLEIIFDNKQTKTHKIAYIEKSKCFFKYITSEFALIKNLIVLKDQSNFEPDILRIINDRLTLLQKTFKN